MVYDVEADEVARLLGGGKLEDKWGRQRDGEGETGGSRVDELTGSQQQVMELGESVDDGDPKFVNVFSEPWD